MKKLVIVVILMASATAISMANANQVNRLVPDFIAPSVVSEDDVTSPAVGQIVYDMATHSFKGRPANSDTWRELSPQPLVLAKATATMTGPTSANFIAFPSDSNVLNLTPGLWRMGSAIGFSGGLVEGLVSARWATGPGNNSTTSPAGFPTANASLEAGTVGVNYTVATSSSTFPGQSVYIRITGIPGSTTPIYFVPIINASNSLTSVAVTVYAFAERITE